MEKYDGTKVIIHEINRNESLSVIAKSYFGQEIYWKNIYTYNTKAHKILGTNANNIPVGIKIYIPRTKSGYDDYIKKLKLLKSTLIADLDVSFPKNQTV